MAPAVRRFACTQCGRCCNRSPEVELSEAAALADVFVFRLMFRLYWLPDQLSDYLAERSSAANPSEAFYEKKRLLNAFAARKYPAKLVRNGKPVRYTKYLMISALALDTSPVGCAALREGRCGVYDRRPLGCRSVPFHYSRAEAFAEADFKAFVETPGYGCDTGETAEIVIKDGAIVAPAFAAVRADARRLAESDRRWSGAIVSAMKQASCATSLPTLQEIEASSRFAATTTSMRVAWEIARDVGILCADACDRLLRLQTDAMDAALAARRCSDDVAQTLRDMGSEYRRHLESRQSDHQSARIFAA